MYHQHQLGLVAVEAALTSLWPSTASSVKMQQFIIVRVSTILTVSMCSHSDWEPYKNLPQSHCVDTELLQQEPAAAAEGEETLTQSAEHRAGSNQGPQPRASIRFLSIIKQTSTTSTTKYYIQLLPQLQLIRSVDVKLFIPRTTRENICLPKYQHYDRCYKI